MSWTLHAARLLGGAALASLAVAPPELARPAPRDASTLAVQDAGEWRVWWRSDSAPARWTSEHALVSRAVQWRRMSPGLELGMLRLAGDGEAWRVGVVLARMEPGRFDLRLQALTDADGWMRPWSIDEAPRSAAFAINAGQFGELAPWGWLVLDGRERKPPGHGPLSAAFVVDTARRARLVPWDSLPAARARGGVSLAFQSYPVILSGSGDVPLALREEGRGVRIRHRDSRVAVGELADGRLLFAITRFEALGGALSSLPFGPSVPEMAAVMGALGARRAMLLDGGISGQMLMRGEDGTAHAWRGLRRVPVGLVATPRHAVAQSVTR